MGGGGTRGQTTAAQTGEKLLETSSTVMYMYVSQEIEK